MRMPPSNPKIIHRDAEQFQDLIAGEDGYGHNGEDGHGRGQGGLHPLSPSHSASQAQEYRNKYKGIQQTEKSRSNFNIMGIGHNPLLFILSNQWIKSIQDRKRIRDISISCQGFLSWADLWKRQI